MEKKKYDIKLEGFINDDELGFEGKYKGDTFLVKASKAVFKGVVKLVKEAIKEMTTDSEEEDKEEEKDE